MHARLLQLCLTLQTYGLQPSKLLCPWDSAGRNTGVSCQGFVPTQGSNPHLLRLLLVGGFFTTCAIWEALNNIYLFIIFIGIWLIYNSKL